MLREDCIWVIEMLLKNIKRSIFTIVDRRIKFYSQNTNLLPPKPKSSFRHLKQGTHEFHRKVQVGKDQEKAQSEIPTPKTEVGKNQTNN